MFRLITRRRIHESSSDSELLIKMATLPAPSLASVAPETPPAVCAIVDRALAFERDKRYPSATAMLQDIRAVRAGFTMGPQAAPNPAARGAGQPPAVPRQVVLAAASSDADEALGTAQTVAAPHAAAAWAGHALVPSSVPSSAASARASGNDDPRPALSPDGGMGLANLANRHAPVAAREASKAQHAPGNGSAVAPTRAPSSTASAFTQATQWTVTTVRGRRLRWAALAFPLLGAGVLAIVYYRAVHVDSDATPPASSRALKPLASPTRSPAAAAGARSAAAVVDPSLDKMGGERPRLPSRPPRGSEQGAGALPQTNCMATNTCDHVCDDACELSCMDQRGCEIGARRDALVNCTGSMMCNVSCEGDCVINCSEGTPCLVRCTPGSRCVIGECPGQIETCASGIIVCGAKCPD
jgi:serine/threonine-protein kinase